MVDEQIRDFFEDVKYNCNISDAKYWGYFSICGLLMRLRELYRAEHGLKPWSPIDRNDILRWIGERERIWSEMEDKDFRNLKLFDEVFEPFELSEINNRLKKRGIVYGAGYGLYMKPTFFIGKLCSYLEISDYSVYLVGDELVRDIFTSSGMLQGRCIFLRLAPMKTHLWEKFNERGSGKNPLFDRLFSGYDFSSNALNEDIDTLFDEVSLKLSSIILNHEIAEAMEDIPVWQDIIVTICDRESEHRLRFLKDIIADTSEYGPLKKIIETEDIQGIALYISLIENYRAPFYIKFRKDILLFMENNDWSGLENLRMEIYKKVRDIREKIVDLFLYGRLKDEIKSVFSDATII